MQRNDAEHESKNASLACKSCLNTHNVYCDETKAERMETESRRRIFSEKDDDDDDDDQEMILVVVHHHLLLARLVMLLKFDNFHYCLQFINLIACQFVLLFRKKKKEKIPSQVKEQVKEEDEDEADESTKVKSPKFPRRLTSHKTRKKTLAVSKTNLTFETLNCN